MVYLFNFYFILFVFSFIEVPCGNAFSEIYVPLIVDLRHEYGTSSVIIINRYYEDDLKELTYAQSLTRRLSRAGVKTMIINYTGLELRNKPLYNTMIPRPLIVATIRSLEDIDSLNKTMPRREIMSYPIWLMIFEGTANLSMCDYCRNVTQNIFGIRFDTEMLIICCNDTSIREWYYYRPDGLEKGEIGNWTIEDGLRVYVKKNVFTRRTKINGTNFRLGIVTKSGFLERENPMKGFFGKIAKLLSRSMNFTIVETKYLDTFGTWNTTTGNWSGAIEAARTGQIDLGLGEFTISRKRSTAVDFTVPLMLSRTRLYIKPIESFGIQWTSYFRAFDVKIWMTTLLAALVTAVTISLIKVILVKTSFMYLFFENWINSIGILCQQGLAEFPIENSLRIAYLSLFILALVISGTYSALLTSFLTVHNPSMQFSSLEEFVNDGSYRLIVLRDTLDWDHIVLSNDQVIMKIHALLKPYNELPTTLSQALEMTCQKDNKVAFMTSDIVMRAKNLQMPCKMYEINTGRVESFGMIMPYGNQYTKLINFHIQRFQDNGVLTRYRLQALATPSAPTSKYISVDFESVVPMFIILSIGVVLSFTLLACERIFHFFMVRRSRHYTKKRKPRSTIRS